MTNRSVPAQNVKEMLDWARTDKVNFAHGAPASLKRPPRRAYLANGRI